MKLTFPRRTAVAVAATVAVLGAGAAAMASTAIVAATPTITACVSSTNVVQHLYAHAHTCPIGQHKIAWNQVGPRGLQGNPGVNYQPVTASAAFSVTNDPDSAYTSQALTLSNGGIWALDNFTAQWNLTRHSAVALSNCSAAPTGNSACYYYTGEVTENGTFTTLSGANSPNTPSTPISGIVTGPFMASFHVEFYANSGDLSTARVPVSIDDSVAKIYGSGNPAWYEKFFPVNTVVQGVNQPDWTFNYGPTVECESWTDAYNVAVGSGGNITGTNHCPTS